MLADVGVWSVGRFVECCLAGCSQACGADSAQLAATACFGTGAFFVEKKDVLFSAWGCHELLNAEMRSGLD